MSTANKLTYLNTTKQKIKDGINALGGELTNESTFRSYANVLNDLYEELPKVESEETTSAITLSPTQKAKLSLTLKGNIEQDSTTGKNLAQRIGGYLTADGTFKTSNDDSFYFLVTQGETYTYNATGNRTLGAIYDNVPSNNATPISGTFSNNMIKNTPFTASATGIMVIYANTPSSQDTINSFIAVKGNEIGDYEPYTGNSPSPSPSYPQDIHIVSGDNEIKIQNKNLLPFENINVTKNGLNIYSSNGNLYINGTNSSPIYSTEKLFEFTLNAGTYTSSPIVSGIPNYFLRKKSDNTTINESNRTFTLNETTDVYLCAFIGANTYNNYQVSWQLEPGSTTTSYVEHQEYTKEINLGELEVGGIGEYEDEFFKNTIDSGYYDSTLEQDKWYLKKRIGKVVLDGSEEWDIATATGFQAFVLNGTVNTGSLIGFSNYYKNFASSNWTYMENNNFIVGRNNNQIIIRNDNILTTSDLETWLSTHNTTVYYVLATPENILLNDTLQETLDSFYSMQGQTNISQTNNDLPFIIKASALKDFTTLE